MAILSLITKGDHLLMQRANNWHAPRWVRFSALAATRLGDGWVWYLCGLCVFLFGDGNRFAALGAAGSAALASIITFHCLKRATGRRRPCHIEPHCWARLLPPDQFSFPSGHTMTAFSVAVSLSLFYSSAAPILVFLACCVAASRVLLGMHFLSDVLAGTLIGTGLGYAGYFAFQ